MNQRSGRSLSREYGVDADQSLYSGTGGWYGIPSKFPLDGYIVFHTEEDYLRSPYLQRGQSLNVLNGISSIPGYNRVR